MPYTDRTSKEEQDNNTHTHIGLEEHTYSTTNTTKMFKIVEDKLGRRVTPTSNQVKLHNINKPKHHTHHMRT